MRLARRPVLHAVFLLAILAGAFLLSETAPAQQTFYHGNVRSRIFHRPGCRHFECKACTVMFKSREEAIQSGFRPCKVCKP